MTDQGAVVVSRSECTIVTCFIFREVGCSKRIVIRIALVARPDREQQWLDEEPFLFDVTDSVAR